MMMMMMMIRLPVIAMMLTDDVYVLVFIVAFVAVPLLTFIVDVALPLLLEIY
jgi:hypothetical protein